MKSKRVKLGASYVSLFAASALLAAGVSAATAADTATVAEAALKADAITYAQALGWYIPAPVATPTPTPTGTATTTPPGTTFTDAFTGTNGAALDSGNWTLTSNGGSALIQSNKARFTNGASGAYLGAQNALASGMTATANMDVLVTGIAFQSPTVNQTADVVARMQGTAWNGNAPYNGYQLELLPSSNQICAISNVAGQQTYLGSACTSYAFAAGTAVNVRLQTVGSTIRWRAWNGGTTEPSTWTQSVADTSISGAGKAGLSTLNGAAAAYVVDFDAITVTPA